MDLSEIIPIGEWVPDQPEYNAGGCLLARNTITNGDKYVPVPDIAALADAVGDDIMCAYSYIGADGTIVTFAASGTKIYKKNGMSWDDVTNTGGDYSTPADGSWQFTQFGSLVIATNYVDKIQKFEVGTDTEFGDLITSGPDVKCRNLGVINNFLVCVGINDSDGERANRVRWSPIGNPEGDWTPDITTQSDYQDLEDGNPGAARGVIGSQNSIAGQNYGIIVCRNAMVRMEYVGPDTIFNFRNMETGRGAVHENAFCANGANIVFYDENGLFEFDGTRSKPIGHRKVDKYIGESIDKSYYHNIAMGADITKKVVYFSFTKINPPTAENSETIVYNWADQRFTSIDEGYSFLFRTYAEGTTLEELSALYSDLETVPYSLDSRYWQGGGSNFASFIGDQLYLFTGENKTAYFETQDVRLNTSGLTYIESILPVYQGGTAEVRLGTKNLADDDVTYTSYYSISSDTGEVNFDTETRYSRASIKMSDDWEHFQGVQFRAGPAGGI